MIRGYYLTHNGSPEHMVFHEHRLDANGRPGVILIHGRGALAKVFGGYYGPENDMVYQIIRHGNIALAIDAGGVAEWGNNNSVAAVAAAKTRLQDVELAASGPVVLVGVSMGALIACNYARQYPANVAGLALLYPAVALESVYQNNAAYQTEINTALGVSTAGGRATYDPSQNTVDFLTGGTPRFPIKIWYSQDDPVIPQANVVQFATDVQADIVNLGNHQHDLVGMDPVEVARFVRVPS